MLRLDRYLSNATALTRSQAHKALRSGRVSVDGKTIKQGAFQIAQDAKVFLDGQPVAAPGSRYLMLHKPLGVVCATEDPTHRTAIDLLDLPNPQGLHFAGRLDIDATGLVLITDDGQWSHRITSPSKQCAKTYLATLASAIPETALERIRNGILLRGERHPTAPAQADRLNDTQVRLTITEGRYHQVKRLFAAVDNRVVSLHRESIGELRLDAALTPGSYRALSVDEIDLFN
ncbi:MAG: 16S rRNA pseudouridine(516) synthase RsuA [Candidatus Thiodiazotropha sp.]